MTALTAYCLLAAIYLGYALWALVRQRNAALGIKPFSTFDCK